MSEYVTVDTESMEDEDILVESLEELGVPKSSIQIGSATLNGYFRSEKADIVIPAKYSGTGKDLGFVKDANGYRPMIYDYDLGKGLAKQISSGELLKCYKKRQILKALKRHRGIKEERLKDGRIRIRVKK